MPAADVIRYIITEEGQLQADCLRTDYTLKRAYEQMRLFAIAKSAMTGEKIYFGIIDGDDTQRLKLAYPKQFE
jgi:hypothetical protein